MRAALLLRIPIVAAVLLGQSCADDDPESRVPDSDTAAKRACRYLWSKQADDGGWHSEHYGLLRSGQSLTAHVLATLLDVPEDVSPRDPAAVSKAAAFLVAHVNDEGALGLHGGDLDYPNYASGLALSALERVGGHDATVRKLRSYLLGQQFGNDDGRDEEHPAFGSWGMGGRRTRAPAHPGHVDLSMTRVVLQGLAASKKPPTAAFSRSHVFLRRCTSRDGGFFFSTVVLGANKAGRKDGEFQSYGTTTADGILALLATGVSNDDDRVRRARDWLVARHRVDRVPGIPDEVPALWDRGLRFYYLAVSAEALSRLGIDAAPAGRDWRREIVREITRSQREDGSWVNPVGQVKEDDPLIATALAIRALLAARKR